VGDYLHRGAPGSGGLIGLGVPNLAKVALLGEGLHEDGDPSLAVLIPDNVAGVGDDLLAFGCDYLLLRLEFDPGARILPRLERGWHFELREGIAEHDPSFPLFVGPVTRLPVREERFRVSLAPHGADM